MRNKNHIAEDEYVASTLGLGGDGDELDLLDAVQNAFDVTIADPEAQDILTVGQFFDVMVAKVPCEPEARRCMTAMAFYRLRRSIGQRRARPDSRLKDILTVRPGPTFRRLAHDTALVMPSPVVGLTGLIGSAAAVLFVVGSVATIDAGWPYWPVPLVLAAGAATFVYLDCGQYRETTLGDLARQVAALNFARFAGSGARSAPNDAWAAFVTLLSIFTGVAPGRIARETRII